MKDTVKAALLSALVLPGVGQLYRGKLLKGGLMVVVVTILIIATLIYAAFAVQGVFHALNTPAQVPVDPSAAMLGRLKPGLRWIGAAFICLWIYGVADALLDREPRDKGVSGK